VASENAELSETGKSGKFLTGVRKHPRTLCKVGSYIIQFRRGWQTENNSQNYFSFSE
jgi:hypothetical protein